MYLFVFNWVPALQEAARPDTVLPLGYIFSAFMVSMMIGSLLYTSLVSLFSRGEHDPLDAPASDAPLTLHAKLSSLVCAVSAVAFAVSVESTDERVRFWAFCTFEACVGMYYPIQGMLRGSLISNEHRATVSLFSILDSSRMLNGDSSRPCSACRSIFLSSFPSSPASPPLATPSSPPVHSCLSCRR